MTHNHPVLLALVERNQMKKTLFILAAFSVVGAANAQWTQNNLINVAGGGTGAIAGGDLSQLVAPENLFGWGAQTINSNTMADDFTVSGGGWTVTAIRLYTYQTGATAPSITGVNWAIGSSATTSLTAAVPASVGWWAPNGVGVYRVSSGVTTDANRRIQEVVIDVPDFNLADGTYFLSVNMAGTGTSGPWIPAIPSAQAVNGQNALQSTSGGPFNPAFVDGASIGGDMPFVIEATPIPEPATMALLGLGAAAVLRRRNKK